MEQPGLLSPLVCPRLVATRLVPGRLPFGLVGPPFSARVPLMWMVRWSIMVWGSGQCMESRIVLTYLLQWSWGPLPWFASLSFLESEVCSWPFLPQQVFEPQGNLLTCRLLRAATTWLFSGVLACEQRSGPEARCDGTSSDVNQQISMSGKGLIKFNFCLPNFLKIKPNDHTFY